MIQLQKTENRKAVPFVCLNCKTTNVGWQDSEGLTRVKCEKCGAVTVSKVMSRRHVQFEVFVPKGKSLNEMITNLI